MAGPRRRRLRRAIRHWRIAASRWLSRRFLRRQEMVCAWADWLRWPARRALNALFLDPRHCEAAADWEAREGQPLDLIDDWRREGWL